MQRKAWTYVPQFIVAILFVMFLGVSSFAGESENMLGADSVVRNQLVKKLGNEDDVRALCSGLKKCLDVDFRGCSAGDKHPWPHLKYDNEYCGVFREVVKRGFEPKPGVPMAEEVFARLGRRYRAVYENKGTLMLGENVINYLFDNMPFTADLINAYLGTNYELEYTSKNRRYFRGSNGRSLSGEFYWALQDSAGQKLGLRNLFFGYGHAQVLRWSLHGSAVAFLDMDEVSKRELKYKLTAIVFPGNSVLNSIMQMQVFKNVVNDKIDHIVNDIKKSSGRYFGGDKEPMLNNAKLKSFDNVQYVIDFENVVNGAPWKLGDFEKLKKEREKQRLESVPIKVDDTRIQTK